MDKVVKPESLTQVAQKQAEREKGLKIMQS
jgi:hypothetical protein